MGKGLQAEQVHYWAVIVKICFFSAIFDHPFLMSAGIANVLHLPAQPLSAADSSLYWLR